MRVFFVPRRWTLYSGLMRIWLIILGGSGLVLAGVVHLYVRICMRPPDDLDVYHEFEEQDPAYGRYLRWSQWTLGAACLGTLLLFLALVL